MNKDDRFKIAGDEAGEEEANKVQRVCLSARILRKPFITVPS